MTKFLDIFFGTPQSKFAAYAIFIAIIAISLSILFSSTDISFGNRFLVVLFVILLSVPSILLTLFELTCIVTGGNKKVNWWCWYFGWLIAGFLVIYSVIIIISILISMFSYNNAMDRIKNTEHRVSKEEANDYAKTIIVKEQIIRENFENAPGMPPQGAPGMPPQPFVNKEHFNGMPPPGMPPQGMPGMPPQGMPPQPFANKEHFTEMPPQQPGMTPEYQKMYKEMRKQMQEGGAPGMPPQPFANQEHFSAMPPSANEGEKKQKVPLPHGIKKNFTGMPRKNKKVITENFAVNGENSIPAPLGNYNYSSF